MSYVQSILLGDERVLLIAKLHWIHFKKAILIGIVFAVSIMIYISSNSTLAFVFVMLAGLAFLIAFIAELVTYICTELAVTDKRVIHKTGVISRQTMEQQIARIDSITVSQTIVGRILGYGTIDIRGSGTSFTPIEKIASPLNFRREVQHAMDMSSGQAPQSRGA